MNNWRCSTYDAHACTHAQYKIAGFNYTQDVDVILTTSITPVYLFAILNVFFESKTFFLTKINQMKNYDVQVIYFCYLLIILKYSYTIYIAISKYDNFVTFKVYFRPSIISLKAIGRLQLNCVLNCIVSITVHLNE